MASQLPQDNNPRSGLRSNAGMAGSTQTPANQHLGQDKPGVFDKEGPIGKQFTPEGAIGGAAQKIGGPLDKEGMIGKQFTPEGSIGGTVQDTLGGMKKKSN
ncbi:hypothetical protein VTJ49DRAFT_3208 [Mycothermus thermophilus]|uniref:Uncharacterized protein n=1 Tax=Humicola insolens TaxID=85995 RepID=A0ABR3VMX5_HUMIN